MQSRVERVIMIILHISAASWSVRILIICVRFIMLSKQISFCSILVQETEGFV